MSHVEDDQGVQTPTALMTLRPVRWSRKNESGRLCEDLMSLQRGGYWDDAKGGWLDPRLVTEGREEEMGYGRKHQVYVRVPREMCWRETGKAPVKTGWADTNKGTAEHPNVRCRWVAKEFNTGPSLCTNFAIGRGQARRIPGGILR